MKYIIVFITLLVLVLSKDLSKPNDHQKNLEYPFSKDENTNTKTAYITNEIINLTTSATDVAYYFYSKVNPIVGYKIPYDNIDALLNTTYSILHNTVFIIHGWQNDYTSDVNEVLRAAILKNHNVNIFVVDWSKIAKQDYSTAQASVPQIGDYVGAFIKSLQDRYGLLYSQLTIVGHSLGAHLSGCVGAALDGKVEEIVGLDPAGPLFTESSTDNRIHKGNAKLVTIIHTNKGGLGYVFDCGDYDFYPNGGETQPGCESDGTGACSHSRSYQFYAESINSSAFTAQKCNSYVEYISGKCNGSIAMMGGLFSGLTGNGSFYLQTNSKSPYGRG